MGSPIPYVINDWSGGMNNVLDPERLNPNQSEYLENIEYRDGILRTRRGSRMLYEGITGEVYQGSGIFKNTNAEELVETVIVAQGGSMYRIKVPGDRQKMVIPLTTGASPVPDLNVEDEVTFVQGLTKLYIFRGEGKTPWSWTGVETDAVIEVPAPAILNRISGSSRVIFAYNRFWTATGRTALEISDSLEERVDLINNSIEINSGDGERIIDLSPFRNNTIIVFKDSSAHIITNATTNITNAATDLNIEELEGSFGLLAKDSLVRIGNDLWGLSRKGVFSVTVNAENNIRLIDVPLSREIQKTVDRISLSSAHKASALHFDNYFVVAVPIDNAMVNNAILVYDLVSRAWVGMWRFRDSTGVLLDSNSDPVFEIRKLLRFNRRNKEQFFIIGGTGEVVQMLTNDEKDFISGGGYGLIFTDAADGQTIDLDETLTKTAVLSQTTGIIHFKIKVDGDAPLGGRVFSFFDDSTTERIIGLFSSGKLIVEAYDDSTNEEWEITSNTTFIKGGTYQVSIVHDGASPVMYINNELDFTLTPLPIDATAWFSDYTGIDKARIGRIVSAGPTDTGLSELFTMYFFGVYEYTGTWSTSGKEDIVFFFPFNEGSGTVLNEPKSRYVEYEDGTFVDWEEGTGSVEWENAIKGSLGADITWTSKTTPSHIYVDWISYAIFNGTESEVKGLNGEIRFVHKNPKVSLKLHTPLEKTTKALELTDKEYSDTAYETDHITWNAHNMNLDFDDDYRENYAAVEIGSGLLLDGGAICINREAERSERFNFNKSANRFKIQVTNSQGTIGIKNVIGVGEDKGPLKIRSM